MNDQPSMIAMIRTLLYFVGKQNYMPTANDVLPILREALAGAALAAPVPIGSNSWDKSTPSQWNSTTPPTTQVNSKVMLPLGARQQRA